MIFNGLLVNTLVSSVSAGSMRMSSSSLRVEMRFLEISNFRHSIFSVHVKRPTKTVDCRRQNRQYSVNTRRVVRSRRISLAVAGTSLFRLRHDERISSAGTRGTIRVSRSITSRTRPGPVWRPTVLSHHVCITRSRLFMLSVSETFDIGDRGADSPRGKYPRLRFMHERWSKVHRRTDRGGRSDGPGPGLFVRYNRAMRVTRLAGNAVRAETNDGNQKKS